MRPDNRPNQTCAVAAGLRGALCAVAMLLSACGAGELDGFAPLTLLDNFRAIEPGRAYRSAQLDATTLRLVVEGYGIRTIVNLRGENDDETWYQRERALADELSIALVDVRMSAHALPERAELLRLYDTFVAAEQPILIHCKAGADRTGAAAAIWRMVVLGESRATAAARELSPLTGHFTPAAPEMDELVAIFEPDRDWIANAYPGATIED